MQIPFLSRAYHGFTLIELLVVMIILALLGTVVGPQVMKYVKRAKSNTAKLQIADFGVALDIYALDVGDYPSTEQGLQALVEAPVGTDRWAGPYMKKKTVPLDPWDTPYKYRAPGENGDYDLYSLGKDNTPGGERENQDIVSWE